MTITGRHQQIYRRCRAKGAVCLKQTCRARLVDLTKETAPLVIGLRAQSQDVHIAGLTDQMSLSPARKFYNWQAIKVLPHHPIKALLVDNTLDPNFV